MNPMDAEEKDKFGAESNLRVYITRRFYIAAARVIKLSVAPCTQTQQVDVHMLCCIVIGFRDIDYCTLDHTW